MAIPAWAHYREADTPAHSCADCDFFDAVRSTCQMFDDTPVERDMVCDRWQYRIEKADDVQAAGIAVRARDTGRVLMIQRSNDPEDPARGTWEFPGGKREPGEHPLHTAKREWQEEMGARLPRGQHVGEWRSGVYHGFIHEVRSEAQVPINRDPEKRAVMNPDDPDGDNIETAAWWDPEHLKNMKALRPELRNSRPWRKVAKADEFASEVARAVAAVEPTLKIELTKAAPTVVHLRVTGSSRTPDGSSVYRMGTSDGKYVGATSPTRFAAKKGDVLKIQTNDIFLDDAQQVRWMGANVAAGYDDAPASWEEIMALAGGTVVKDDAPGVAGNIPAATDQGDSRQPSGPTLSAVHVPGPLPNISQAYVKPQTRRRFGTKEAAEEDDTEVSDSVLRGEFLPVAKADRWKQLVYGVVLEPHVLDSQEDFMLPHHIEASAHGYLKKAIRGRSSVAKLQHRMQGFKKDRSSIVPVESYIAPVDFSYDGKEMIKKGTWVMVMHVEDEKIWQDVLDGKYTGFSVGGSGIRHSVADAAALIPHGLMNGQDANYLRPDPRRLGGISRG